MNFMNEIRPCATQMAKLLPDGSIDREHYEIKARQERAAAMRALFRAIVHGAQRLLTSPGRSEPARMVRQG